MTPDTSMPFDFSKLLRPRGSYEQTLQSYRDGWLSLGFIWELARHDEVFGAYLRKHKVEML